MTCAAQVDSPGYFYAPTVLTNVSETARISKEEIFGPVAAINVFDSEDEVIERPNGSDYGLISYVSTSDTQRGLRESERLESGMIGLNWDWSPIRRLRSASSKAASAVKAVCTACPSI